MMVVDEVFRRAEDAAGEAERLVQPCGGEHSDALMKERGELGLG